MSDTEDEHEDFDPAATPSEEAYTDKLDLSNVPCSCCTGSYNSILMKSCTDVEERARKKRKIGNQENGGKTKKERELDKIMEDIYSKKKETEEENEAERWRFPPGLENFNKQVQKWVGVKEKRKFYSDVAFEGVLQCLNEFRKPVGFVGAVNQNFEVAFIESEDENSERYRGVMFYEKCSMLNGIDIGTIIIRDENVRHLRYRKHWNEKEAIRCVEFVEGLGINSLEDVASEQIWEKFKSDFISKMHGMISSRKSRIMLTYYFSAWEFLRTRTYIGEFLELEMWKENGLDEDVVRVIEEYSRISIYELYLMHKKVPFSMLSWFEEPHKQCELLDFIINRQEFMTGYNNEYNNE